MQTVERAAAEIGISRRQARRLSERKIGSVKVLTDREIVALSRMGRRGRPWTLNTRSAALDLICGGDVDRSLLRTSSEWSRLKHRLAHSDNGDLAGQLLRDLTSTRRAVGDAETPQAAILKELGLAAIGGTGVLVARDAVREARRRRLAPDANGDVVVVEMAESQHQRVLEALTLFAYGDARESAAAGAWLDAAKARL